LRLRFAVPAVASLAVLAASTAEARQVTATHTVVKLKPTDAAPTDAEAYLSAAANEGEGFQAVIAGGGAGLAGVSAEMSDLEGPATIGADRITVYREAYMNVRHPSDANGTTGRVPDALVPAVDPFVREKRNAFPFDVPAGEIRTLWVDVYVPSGTPAGLYRGQLAVTADGGFRETLPVSLEVFPFELPPTPSYATAFGMAWSGTCQAHTGSADCGGDTAKFDRLRRLYGIAGLDNRLSLSAVAGEPPGGKPGNRNWSRYDATVRPLLDGTASTRLEGARLTSVEVYEQHPTRAQFADWAKHFRDKGWFDRLFDYTCDEPPLTCAWNSIKPREDAAHAADPELKTLVTTQMQHAEEHGIAASTDILVPVVNFVEGKADGKYPGDHSALYREHQRDGGVAWIYSSCMSHGCGGTVDGEYGGDPALAGWPSLVIDHTALRNRAMPWVAFGRGFTGELYWDTTYAFTSKSDPWSDQYDFTGNGDGTLWYPGTPKKIGGKTDVPVESIRVKEIRDGVEDYEYLKLLEEAEGADAARDTARKLMPHAWSAGDITPEELLATRRDLARRISAVVAPGQVPGEEPGSVATGGSDAAGGCTALPGGPAPFGLAFAALALLRRRRRR
jgi:uncharacterized protein (TIGR03382 family)